MHNRVQFCGTPDALIFDLLDLRLVCPLKDSVASDVVSLLLNIFLDSSKQVTIMDTCCLEHARQIVNTEVSIGASMGFASSWWMLGQDLLTRVRRVATTTAVGVSSNIAINMAHVIPVLLIEGIVCDLIEGLTPEHQAIFQVKTDTLQEEGILQSSEMLKMAILSESSVKMLHA